MNFAGIFIRPANGHVSVAENSLLHVDHVSVAVSVIGLVLLANGVAAAEALWVGYWMPVDD